jgi:hypothetical protein
VVSGEGAGVRARGEDFGQKRIPVMLTITASANADRRRAFGDFMGSGELLQQNRPESSMFQTCLCISTDRSKSLPMVRSRFYGLRIVNRAAKLRRASCSKGVLGWEGIVF